MDNTTAVRAWLRSQPPWAAPTRRRCAAGALNRKDATCEFDIVATYVRLRHRDESRTGNKKQRPLR